MMFSIQIPITGSISEKLDVILPCIGWTQLEQALEQPTETPFKDKIPVPFSLHFRKYPFSHPILGRVQSVKKLIFKRILNSSQLEFIGLISKSCQFQEMADFQYQPTNINPFIMNVHDILLKGDSTSFEDIQNLANQFIESSTVNIDSFLAPPPFFSLSSVPPIVYDLSPHTISTTHQSSKTPFFYYQIQDKNIPSKPPQSFIQNISLSDIPQEWITLMNGLFSIRPVWSTIAILNKWRTMLDLNDHMFSFQEKQTFKTLLKMNAFYYSNGPWRCCWIKYGYYPFQNSESRIWQILELRLLFQTQSSELFTTPNNPTSHILDNNPSSMCHILQLEDIHDNELGGFIRESSNYSTIFDEKHGWYSPGFKDRLISLIKIRYKDVIRTAQMERGMTMYSGRISKRWQRSIESKDDDYEIYEDQVSLMEI